jgi:hypothetical protein
MPGEFSVGTFGEFCSGTDTLSASHAVEDQIREQAVKTRDEVAAMMTPAQIVEAQRMAREWRPTK